MKKELIGIRDHQNNWSFIMDVSYTENKNIKNVEYFVDVVKQIPEFNSCEFIEENDFEIFAVFETDIDFCFNAGNFCKILSKDEQTWVEISE